jgi:hypothetical protein
MNCLGILAVIPASRLCSGTPSTGAGTIVNGNFAAVVTAPPKDGIQGRNRSELMPLLLANQGIVESVLAFSPLLPVGFGTVADDDRAVRDFLAEGRPLFEQAFSVLGDRIEINLAVRWDVHDVVREIAMEGSLASRLAAAVTDGERQEAGAELARLVDERRHRFSNQILDAVRPHATDLIAPYPRDPEQVADMALLLDRDVLDSLEHTLDQLDGSYGGKLSFRLVGPMPPYSFATVQVSFPRLPELDQARAVLGVDRSASADEIKTAYHRAVREVHPDLAPCSTDGTAEMTRLTEAYEVLRDNRLSVSLLRGQGA